MQIIDRQDENELSIALIIPRHQTKWDPENDDTYVNDYLKCMIEHMKVLSDHGGLNVYDVYKTLDQQPKAIFAHIGWSKQDICQISYFVNDRQIMIEMKCGML